MSKKTQSGNRRSLFAGASVLAAAAAALTATPAVAQDEEEEAIVVTGSRIARQDYVANSPIVTVGQEALEISGAQTVDTLINQLPQFAPGINQSANNPSNGGQANIQLRGLGANRTLVLLNGRRVVPSNSTTTVDVNVLPAQLVGNIEVVTGGASAAYGSDAVGGVVNFQLREFEGFEISAQYGISEESDGEQNSISAALGGEFDGGRGRAMFMASWDQREVIYNAARDFAAFSGPSGASPLGNTVFEATNAPLEATVDATVGTSLLATNNLETFGFNQDGTLFSYSNRVGFNSPGGIGFDGNNAAVYPGSPIASADFAYTTGFLNYMVLPLERWNAFSSVEYDINPNLTAFGEFLYTQYTSANELAATPAAAGTGFRVPTTNPFIPAELATLLASRPTPGGTFRLDKRFTALGGRNAEERYNVSQTTFGLRGDLTEEWTFDVYASYGRMDRDTIQTGNVSRGAVQRLLSAADGGASLCTGGFNPFGDQALSQSCVNYIGRTSKNVSVYEQRNVEATIQGSLFELPAGEIQVALGAGYREDSFEFIPDGSLSAAISFQPTGCGAATNPCLTGNDVAGFNPANPLAGGTDVFELFGEILIPVIRDVPLAEEVNFTLGYRVSDYSTVGQVESYKGDVDWTMFDGLRFRGGIQRAVRAPSVGELFAIPTLGFPSIGNPLAAGVPAFSGDPCDSRSAYRSVTAPAGVGDQAAASNTDIENLCVALGVPLAAINSYTFTNNQIPAVSGGNPDLLEETADTWNAGFVFTPRFDGLLENLSVSVDYWNIEIEGIIGTVGVGTALDQCFNRNGTSNPTYDSNNFFCQLFTRDAGTGQMTDYAASNQNLGGLRTSGVDISLDWSHEVGPGDLGLNWIGSWLEESTNQPLPGGQWIDTTGTIANTVASAAPEWKWTGTLSYAVGPFSVAGRMQWIDEMQNFNVASQQIPQTTYYDLLGNWDVTDYLTLRAGVNNVTNEEPPVYTTGVQANTDPATYDVVGRRFFVGLRARF
ncbi:TonB-dependent receptor domain-containing protein [Vitreimonas flagellata]|uniref:TonB-dependent receptor domain-containing protein n=1 Tax=Vitreimonas flagellata TaxID=2560861 RepID=UPI00107511E1|nr:TonB-dependent receptor [Vitreimonas flagellata]